MRAWLERLSPPGDDITLPDEAGAIVFGRSPKATLVVDDPLVSARHCEVSFDRGFWRVRDLGTARGTRINGDPVRYPRVLTRGDVIELGLTRLRFQCEEPAENEALLAAVIANPDDEAPWAVWADWLLEHGDPLGDRLARAHRGEKLDHQPWLGPLWGRYLTGELEISWRHGFVQRATLRAVAGKTFDGPGELAGQLFGLRVGRMLEELLIDVPRLPVARGQTLSAVAEQVQASLAALPTLPSRWRRLSLGAVVTPVEPAAQVHAGLQARAPGLVVAALPVARAVHLEVLEIGRGTTLTGVQDGRRVLVDVTRLRRAEGRIVHLETPPQLSVVTGGNPCFFAREGQGWTLRAGELKGTLRVNGRADGSWALVAGDVIDLPGEVRLRYELLT